MIMPDHIHLFVAGGHDFNLGTWVRGLKRVVAAAVIGGRDRKDSAPNAFGAATTFLPEEKSQSLWQRGFFDHLIRNTESYAQKWDYVRENPVRAGLVSKAEEWQYQGEIALIDRV
jgi:REP element-mobilizing transposase RayT